MDSDSRDNEYNLVIKNLFHGEIMERASAARQIGHLKDGRATNLLVRALNSEQDTIVVNRIIEAMGEIKDAKSTMFIVELLKRELEKHENEQNKSLLFLIVESLMKIGDKRALEQLGILSRSCESDLKQLTEEAIECIDPNWKKNLVK
ncbi:MAG: HEAT repeat domain-containing protein [Candidatus Lokiarchaeota archaeon]|nr:HEAT repeat domain-containing protein [Candidatus Lokiarchaeota archaeon]